MIWIGFKTYKNKIWAQWWVLCLAVSCPLRDCDPIAIAIVINRSHIMEDLSTIKVGFQHHIQQKFLSNKPFGFAGLGWARVGCLGGEGGGLGGMKGRTGSGMGNLIRIICTMDTTYSKIRRWEKWDDQRGRRGAGWGNWDMRGDWGVRND